VPARLRGWQLVFDKPPILPVGGAMANVVERRGGGARGRVPRRRRTSPTDLTEGVLIGNYRRVAYRVAPPGRRTRKLELFR
jgi:hypothetical protein